MFPKVSMGARVLCDAVEKGLGVRHGRDDFGESLMFYGDSKFSGFKKSFDLVTLDMRKARKLRERLIDTYHFKANVVGDNITMHKEVKADNGKFVADVEMSKGRRPSVNIKVGFIEEATAVKRNLEQNPYSLRELSAAFDLVKPKESWKASIAAEIDPMLEEIVFAAILHFTGSNARFKLDGKRLKVRAIGYNEAKLANKAK